MKNIIKIFCADFRRLSTNVVAVVVIMGLSVIPFLLCMVQYPFQLGSLRAGSHIQFKDRGRFPG